MIYADKNLICRDCGNSFLFTAFEQEFYVHNNFTYEIEHCSECRRRHKATNRLVFQRGPDSLPAVRPMRSATGFDCGTPVPVGFEPRSG